MDAGLSKVEPRWKGLLRLVGKHQLASAITTLFDFSVMVACVQIFAVPAAAAALLGAGVGAVVNFQLGRRFTFVATREPLGKQAFRYAIVSGASALFNGLGELALHDGAGVEYVVARAIVAISVSLAWNLPMQRHYVFRAPGSAS